NLSVQTELVYSSRKYIRAEQHLMWRRRNANCPWGTRRSRTRWMVCLVANRGARLGRNRHIDGDLAKEFTISVKYLNAMISSVCNVNMVLRINRNTVWSVELTW